MNNYAQKDMWSVKTSHVVVMAISTMCNNFQGKSEHKIVMIA